MINDPKLSAKQAPQLVLHILSHQIKLETEEQSVANHI